MPDKRVNLVVILAAVVSLAHQVTSLLFRSSFQFIAKETRSRLTDRTSINQDCIHLPLFVFSFFFDFNLLSYYNFGNEFTAPSAPPAYQIARSIPNFLVKLSSLMDTLVVISFWTVDE